MHLKYIDSQLGPSQGLLLLLTQLSSQWQRYASALPQQHKDVKK